MQFAALLLVLAFAAWVAAGGLAGIAKPALARAWIGRFASSHGINIAEQAWRGLAGAALIVRAPLSLSPAAFTVAGWVMVVSSGLLLLVPLRWHAAYARFWSRKLPLGAVRIAGWAALGFAIAVAVSAFGRWPLVESPG